MKLDKYIDALVRLRQEHGPDLQILQQTSVGLRKAGLPRLRYKTKSNPTRRLFIEGTDLDNNRAEPVVLLD